MLVKVHFDTKNNLEIINKKIFPLGENFINFISLDMKNILNEEIISNLSKNNYKDIISKLSTASDGAILEDIINTNNILSKTNINEIKCDLTLILNTYNTFKDLIEFCYFNDNFNNITLLQKYIYYLDKSKIEEVILPKQTISLKLERNSNKLDTENSPYLYFTYECLNINDYMITAFLQLIENNYLILKCKNCSKYFIPYKRTDTLYCDRTSPQDDTKTCKKYAIELAWNEKIKDETDWHCLYRRVYQSLQMKAKRKPNDQLLKKFFEDFKMDAKEWKKAVKEGTKTDEEFLYWLQEFRN